MSSKRKIQVISLGEVIEIETSNKRILASLLKSNLEDKGKKIKSMFNSNSFKNRITNHCYCGASQVRIRCESYGKWMTVCSLTRTSLEKCKETEINKQLSN